MQRKAKTKTRANANQVVDFPRVHTPAGTQARVEGVARAVLELKRRQAANPFAGMIRPLELRGNVLKSHSITDRELLLVGPAGTSKTVGNLQKVHKLLLRYPGSRWLFIRKRRSDLTESVLQTYEEDVLPPGSPIIGKVKRENRFKYYYPNGSLVVCGGMDMATKLFGTKYDGVFANELIEFEEGEYETLLRALRAFTQPFRQLLADTNPGPPSHWIKKRADAGKITMLQTFHKDNPFYWDLKTNTYTPEGREYITEILSGLSGVRRLRLLLGLWAAAEGMIYEDWNPAVHVIPPFQAPERIRGLARRIWSVDFGYYPDPFVWQNWLIDGQGRMYLMREIYQTKRLIEDLARDILSLTVGERTPDAIVCDPSDRGARETLQKHLGQGYTCKPAYNPIMPGIQNVMKRLRVQKDGRPRLMIVQGCTYKPDPLLRKVGRPWSTAGEVEGYIWKPGDNKKEEPLGKDNHGQDAKRYAAAEADGLRSKGDGGTLTVYEDVYGDRDDEDDDY